MRDTSAELRVLEGAFGELNLWELPGRHVYVQAGRETVTPDVPLEAARAALLAALTRGFVELYDPDIDGYPSLSRSDAFQLIGDDAEWDAASASCRVMLRITPAGESAFREAFAAHKRASPFRAASAVDPHVSPDATQRHDE